MMKSTFFAAVLLCGSTLAFSQNFEAAVTGGPTSLSGATITDSVSGTPGAGDSLKLDNGWNLGFRFTINLARIFGTEFGYIYDRSNLLIGGASQGGMAIHQGYGDGVIYATKEGSRIRPFGVAGINYCNFVLPGASAQYGQGQNKFGINYGLGVKFKVTGMWMGRVDFRQVNTGKPDFGLPATNGGRFYQNQFSVGFGIGI